MIQFEFYFLIKNVEQGSNILLYKPVLRLDDFWLCWSIHIWAIVHLIRSSQTYNIARETETEWPVILLAFVSGKLLIVKDCVVYLVPPTVGKQCMPPQSLRQSRNVPRCFQNNLLFYPVISVSLPPFKNKLPLCLTFFS